MTHHNIRHCLQEPPDDRLGAHLTQQASPVALPDHALQLTHVAVMAPDADVVPLYHQRCNRGKRLMMMGNLLLELELAT